MPFAGIAELGKRQSDDGSMTAPNWEAEIDAAGLLCPLPVLKARKRLKTMQRGETLRLIATDPAAVVDVPHYCREAGHEFLGVTLSPPGFPEGARAYMIRRG